MSMLKNLFRIILSKKKLRTAALIENEIKSVACGIKLTALRILTNLADWIPLSREFSHHKQQIADVHSI